MLCKFFPFTNPSFQHSFKQDYFQTLIYFEFLIHDFFRLIIQLSLSTSWSSERFFTSVFPTKFLGISVLSHMILSFLHNHRTSNREHLLSNIPFLINIVFFVEIWIFNSTALNTWKLATVLLVFCFLHKSNRSIEHPKLVRNLLQPLA